jgi:hypothetical protein
MASCSNPEEHPFELEIVVRAHGQEDARISREYTSRDACSTDKAAREVWEGLVHDVKSRTRHVADGA